MPFVSNILLKKIKKPHKHPPTLLTFRGFSLKSKLKVAKSVNKWKEVSDLYVDG